MAQKGFEYEENAYNALQTYKISTGGVAGASHDKPDLTIKKGSKTAGVELKNSPTAAGSLVMKYTKGKWYYGEFDETKEPEKAFMKAMGESKKLLNEMNKSGSSGTKWRSKTPCLQNDKDGKKTIIGAKSKEDAYKKDLANFGKDNEIHIEIPAKVICDYYITKKCSYINVGTHGFFTLNGEDELGLNAKLKKNNLPEIPDFAENASAKIRVRCQYKGGGDYQFVMTLQFGAVSKSPYNIAPIQKGSTSVIDKNALKSDSLLLAFT